MASSDSRFRIYELLFSKPLFDYAKRDGGILTNDVLILGSGEVGTEAFKAAYWCGRYALNNQMNITVASRDAMALQEKIRLEMPAVAMFPSYANLSFWELEDAAAPGGLDKLRLSSHRYDYIIVALGDNRRNHQAAKAVREALQEAENPAKKTVICVFDTENEYPFTSEFFPCAQSMAWVEVCTFGNGASTQEDYRRQQQELHRLALNIDFTYAMEQNQRASLEQVRRRFEEDPYYSESSYACAVHIPYKLALCANFPKESGEKAIDILADAIATENAIYNKLIAVEHERWVAYMAVCGYRPPTRGELLEYAYTDGNDHRDKKRKLHPCMCRCDRSGRHLDEHNKLWDTEDERAWKNLAALDQVSLLLHRIACQRSVPVCRAMPEYFSFVNNISATDNLKVFENLRLSARKLCSDEESSVRLFRNMLTEARAEAEAMEAPEILAALDRIETDFQVVIKRNLRTDFFGNDAALVSRLPFCLWYGKDYKTVITFTKGVLTEDVVVPTMLSAQTAVFVGRFADPAAYENPACRFFVGRGDNTRVIVRQLEASGVAAIAELLRELIESYESPVINCVDCDDPEILMAIGIVASQQTVPVVQFDGRKGFVRILNADAFVSRLEDKSLSIDEFTALTGGVYKNVYSNVGSIEDYDRFTKIYWKYAKERLYRATGKNGQVKSTLSSPWASLASFFQTSSKDMVPDFSPERRVPLTHFRESFEHSVYQQCNVGNFLSSLNGYCIIRNFVHEHQSNGFHRVEFDYVDQELADLVREFSLSATQDYRRREVCLRRRLKFAPAMGISVSNTSTESVLLSDPQENEQLRREKLCFIQDLRQAGMILDVTFSQDQQRVSFTFKNENIQHMFKTHGKIFELILYHGVKNSGLFDEVQTSVQIAWEAEVKSIEPLLKERLHAGNGIGFAYYYRGLKILRDDIFEGNTQTTPDNEIDVVMMDGMTPVFISCKTGKKGGSEWLNEISSVAGHFRARAVLAVMKDLDESGSQAFLARARKMGISLIGSETISSPERLYYALKEIAKGNTVYGPDTNRR